MFQTILFLTILFFSSNCIFMVTSIFRTGFSRALLLSSKSFLSPANLITRVTSAKSDDPMTSYSNVSFSSKISRAGSNNGLFMSLRSFGQKSILPFSREFVIPCIILAATTTKAARKAIAETIVLPISDGKTVIKRQSDDREYLPLTLNNGMRVLLISDKTTVRSAAAMDVHVGSFSDPKDLQGLAHFTEHMSFLGTNKYPKEGDFTDFLSSHGGSSNAYTANEDTVYYFDVNAEFLQQALDRFAEFFIAPLFTASATDRELNAIESEHSKNINNDGFRLYQLERDMANPQHPFSQFSTGNLATLRNEPNKMGIDTRQRLLDFHSRYYSAPLMTLCIVGKESLEDLKRCVESKFAPILDRNVGSPPLKWWGSVAPYVEMLNREVKIPFLQVVPASEGMNYLTVSWVRWVQSPEERQILREGDPSSVVAHLLGHESAGSLRSLLVRRGWTNAVSADISNDDSDLQQFDVHVDLTEEGFQHTNEIVSLIFAYLRMISRIGIPDYIFQELEQLSQINFDYAEKAEVSDYVTTVVANMQEFPSPRQYLTGGRIFHQELCKPLLSDFVNGMILALQPLGADREVRKTICRVTAVSRKFADKTTQTAPYYGTKYNQFDINGDILRTWSSNKLMDQSLHLPAPNPFIPTDFTLQANVVPSLSSSESIAGPVLLRRDESWTLWYEMDRVFRQPKVHMIVSLSLPRKFFEESGHQSQSSAIFVINSKLFSMCLQQSSLNEQLLYDAGLAGLNFNFDLTSKGLQLVVSGFSDKLPLFVQRVCSAIREYTPDKQTFIRVKELLRRELSSWETQQPYAHCAYFAGLVSESLQFPIQDMRAALGKVTLDTQTGFLKNLFEGGSYGTALIVGNIDEVGAKRLLGIVERSFPFSPLPANERAAKRVVLYPAGIIGARLSRNEPNPSDANSACTFYFQLPSGLAADYMPLELLAEVAQQPFYNSLRTQQQLGYIVFCGVKVRDGGVHYLTFTVQSSVANGSRLTELIEKFIKSELLPMVDNMDAQTLQDFKDGIIVRKLEADKRLSQRATRFWSEIITSLSKGGAVEPQFNRAMIEVEGLKKLELQRFKQFARDLLEEGSKGRRLLISQITSTTTTTNDTNESRYSEIGDEMRFATTQPFI